MARRGKPAELNALIAVDKPCGMTSHDVVARVRRAVGERRVGHAGTLDPMASGVMVVGIGQATRLLGRLTLDTKSYVAGIRFGWETNTDDAEGEPVREAALPEGVADAEVASRALAGFMGTGMQVPPAFSAISVDGVRSYKRARDGESVELPARPIEVLSADLLAAGEGEWTAAFSVSKGTYIRALARDIGRAMGSAAHVSALRRTASGSISLADCLALDEVSPETVRERALDPLAALGAPAVGVGEAELADIACGRAVRTAAELPHGVELVGLVATDGLAALARPEGGRLAMDTVFPQHILGVRR